MELVISAKSQETGAAVNRARWNLSGELKLGRGPQSPLFLDGTRISREHVRVHADRERVFITDLSSNGTWLNSRRLTEGEPHLLTPGDTIEIPGFEIHINMIDPAAATNPAPPPGGPLRFARVLGASLSVLDRFVMALALATLTLVMLYLRA